PDGRRSTTMDRLSAFNVFAVLLGTMGGLGAVLAFSGFPAIRAYNRISVWIALFAFAAVAITLDRVFRPNASSIAARVFRPVLLALLLVLAILDQTTEHFVPPYATLAHNQHEMDDFVHSIENRVPSGTMIFQLPYVPFLEHQPPVNMY